METKISGGDVETGERERGEEVTDELLEVGVKCGSSYTASSST